MSYLSRLINFFKRSLSLSSLLGIIIGLLSIILLAIFVISIFDPFGLYRVKLKINDIVDVDAVEDLQLTASSKENLKIVSQNVMKMGVEPLEPLNITLSDQIDYDLNLDVNVPIDTEVLMDETLHLKFDLPINKNLTKEELDLGELVIPFNKKLRIKDELPLDFEIPLDTKIKTSFKAFPNISLPIKAKIPVRITVPINQTLQVLDTLRLKPMDYMVKFNTVLPVEADVPIKQKVYIKGDVVAKVNDKLNIPVNLEKTNITVNRSFDANIDIKDTIVGDVNNKMKLQASFDKPMRVELGELPVESQGIQFEKKKIETEVKKIMKQ